MICGHVFHDECVATYADVKGVDRDTLPCSVCKSVPIDMDRAAASSDIFHPRQPSFDTLPDRQPDESPDPVDEVRRAASMLALEDGAGMQQRTCVPYGQ